MLHHLHIFYSISHAAGSSDHFDMSWYWFYLTKANSQRVKSHIMCAYSLLATLNAIIIPHFCAYFRNNSDQHLNSNLSFCLTFFETTPKKSTQDSYIEVSERLVYLLCGYIYTRVFG